MFSSPFSDKETKQNGVKGFPRLRSLQNWDSNPGVLVPDSLNQHVTVSKAFFWW